MALLTALPFAVFAVTGALTLAFGGAPQWLGVMLVAYSLAALALLWLRAGWSAFIIRSSVPFLVLFAWYAQAPLAPMVLSLTLSVLVALGLTVARVQEETRAAIREREMVAQQLDRRMNELFTLQELSYVLSESLQLDHIVDQVARYARRFLQADGAMVVLLDTASGKPRIVSAEGTLGTLRGRNLEEQGNTLILRAIATERLEAASGDPPGSLVIEGIVVRSAAAIPLRAHGVTMGALLVADRKFGGFTAEDFQLFSTVATHAAVVVANSRFFEMIRLGKEEWETTFNALAEGIAVVAPDGTISRANLALGTLLGVSTTSLVGRPFADTAVGTPEPARLLVQEARDGTRSQPLITRAESLGKVMRLTAAPLGGPGDGASVVILIEDVTEQRKLEAQLIQNEKLAAVGQLVSGVAHELNNPLTSIAGLSEFLVEHSRPNAREREHLQIIHEQAERAGRIVRDLLTFARKGGHEKTRVDFNDLVTRTAALLNYDIKLRGIDLALVLDPAQPSVLGDRYELQQVVLNLLTNAVQAVAGTESGPERIVRAITGAADGSVTFTVQDSGVGIPPDLLPQLFTPFFTTKEPGRGTGLGLSISYGIIEAHGGRLDYNTSPQGGAEFVITLPAFERTMESELPRPGVRTILLVDDDITVHRVVSALFASEGFQVDTARTGEQAFKLTGTLEYDLIIAESRSVVEPGLLFVRALLSLQPGYKDRLIIATDITPLPTREGIPTLTKPFNLRELKAIASSILNQASIPQRSPASTA
ncbi:MAG TPA: ATP-binding protein [Gemmatimonadales bacterium]|nr:ATP-binding protein [Gemmatimonadales bacterium]